MTRISASAMALLTGLAGCADYAIALNDAERGDGVPTDEQGEHDWSDVAALRIDVHPAQTSLDTLSQTFWVDHVSQALDGTPVELHLAPSAQLSGYVTAYEITPWASADLPGEDIAVRATVALRQPDTVQSVVLSTARDGFYEGRVVPDAGYDLQVIPDDPTVPTYVGEVDVFADASLDLDLSGVAVYGQVVDGQGTPLAGASVFLRADGVDTASSVSDAQGWYLVRAMADSEWTVVCTGRADGRDPTIASDEIRVGRSDLRHDLAYGPLDSVTLSGRVLDDEGRPLHHAVVTLEAASLDGYPATTTHEIEVSTSSAGNFTTTALPGAWSVKIRPPDSQANPLDLSPVDLGWLDLDEDMDLGSIALYPFTLMRGMVLDPQGEPVAGTLVRATEEDHGHRSWSTHTATDGGFELLVPGVSMELTLSPPADRSPDLALTRERVDASTDASPALTLAWGERLSGRATAPDGAPLTYALVEVRNPDGSLLAVTVTDDEGRFEVGVAP